jgi:hypothetical protein
MVNFFHYRAETRFVKICVEISFHPDTCGDTTTARAASHGTAGATKALRVRYSVL